MYVEGVYKVGEASDRASLSSSPTPTVLHRATTRATQKARREKDQLVHTSLAAPLALMASPPQSPGLPNLPPLQ